MLSLGLRPKRSRRLYDDTEIWTTMNTNHTQGTLLRPTHNRLTKSRKIKNILGAKLYANGTSLAPGVVDIKGFAILGKDKFLKAVFPNFY